MVITIKFVHKKIIIKIPLYFSVIYVYIYLFSKIYKNTLYFNSVNTHTLVVNVPLVDSENYTFTLLNFNLF